MGGGLADVDVVDEAFAVEDTGGGWVLDLLGKKTCGVVGNYCRIELGVDLLDGHSLGVKDGLRFRGSTAVEPARDGRLVTQGPCGTSVAFVVSVGCLCRLIRLDRRRRAGCLRGDRTGAVDGYQAWDFQDVDGGIARIRLPQIGIVRGAK